MIDREKVIKDLDELHRLIYQSNVDGEILGSLHDAVTLLKEQHEQKTGRWTVLDFCANEGIYCSECHMKICNETKEKVFAVLSALWVKKRAVFQRWRGSVQMKTGRTVK